MKNVYYERYLDKKLKRYMNVFGAVSVGGPRWCGKTTTCKQIANTYMYIDSEKKKMYSEQTMFDIYSFLEGNKPMLLDEWQELPILWDGVRRMVDESGGVPGQYILTGSVIIDRKSYSHSGNGRIGDLYMTTMSLYESKDSTGDVSLESLFNGEDVPFKKSKHTIDDIMHFVCRGGWPASLQYENKEDCVPFIKYILRTILAAYIDFEERVDYVDEKVAAINLVRNAVDNKLGKFTKRDMMELVPSLGKATIENMLKQLTEDGYIERHGKGKSTFYVKK